MLGKSAHLQFIPLQSTQNAANSPLQTCDKNQRIFFIVQHGRQLNFSNLGFLQKFPFLISL